MELDQNHVDAITAHLLGETVEPRTPEEVVSPEVSLGGLGWLLPKLAQLVRSEDRDDDEDEILNEIAGAGEHLNNILGPRGAIRLALSLLWYANDSKYGLDYKVFQLIKEAQGSLAIAMYRTDTPVHWGVKVRELDLD